MKLIFWTFFGSFCLAKFLERVSGDTDTDPTTLMQDDDVESTKTISSSQGAPTPFPKNMNMCYKNNRLPPPPPPPPKQTPKLKQKPLSLQQFVPAPPPVNMQAMGGDTDGCIALQNTARAQVGLEPMHWDAQLARTAQAWAHHLYTYNLGMVHSSGQGQNLYEGTGECKGAYTAWVVNEKPKYYVGAPIDKWGDFESYGHYTQIVYRSTNRAGCSVPHANGGYFVCHYLGQQISGTSAY